MSLVKCEECGADISSDAKACPKCGKRSSGLAKAVAILSAFAGAVFLAYCYVWWLEWQNAEPQQVAIAEPMPEPRASVPSWRLVRTFGKMQVVLVDKSEEQNQVVYREAVADLCAGKSFCKATFWSDAELIPTSLPMTDGQAAGMKADYTYNSTTAHRQMLWSCEIVNDPSQCFTP